LREWAVKNKVDKAGAPKRADAVQKSSVIFAPLKPKRAFEEISAEIKSMIFSGTLRPGEGLPSETQLAGQFGVSRHTVREALRRLELSGFIVVQKGASGGPVVVDTILTSISDLFLDAFQLKRMTTDDLTRARLDIEEMVLKNVFDQDDKEAIDAIGEALEETRKKLDRGIRVFEDNLEFHRLLARATGNYVYVILMESLMTVVAHFHSILRIGRRTIRSGHEFHQRILDAIRKGDRAAAFAELEKDILEVDHTYRNVQQRSSAEQEGTGKEYVRKLV
jgi:GntR family transcriptional regulator, transcriptional repressor for pyruvate dehydrogenase complex